MWHSKGEYVTLETIKIPLSLVYADGYEDYTTENSTNPAADIFDLILEGVEVAPSVALDDPDKYVYRRFDREIDLERVNPSADKVISEAERTKRREERVAKREAKLQAIVAKRKARELKPVPTDEAIKRAIGVKMVDVGFTKSIIGGLTDD